jgi:hypothetical protein
MREKRNTQGPYFALQITIAFHGTANCFYQEKEVETTKQKGARREITHA